MKPPSRDVPTQANNLGKRQRSLDAHDTVSETDQEGTSDEESLSALGRKRTKVEPAAENASEVPLAGPSNSTVLGQTDDPSFDPPPSEMVPSRPPTTSSTTAAPRQLSRDRVVGDEIFTDQDFDFFDNPSNLHQSRSPAGSLQIAENQHPFTFAFPGVAQSPVTATPVAPTGPLADPSTSTLPVLGSLPYPERPHSPSPAPIPYRAVARAPQSESYRPFGFPSESRNPLGSPGPHGSTIDLLRTPPRQSPDIPSPELDSINSRQRASSNGLGVLVDDTPAAPVRRTMYGTELEGDTRFGDFGIEGVATSFWAGGRF